MDNGKIIQLTRCGMCCTSHPIANYCLICRLHACDECVSHRVDSNGDMMGGVICKVCYMPDLKVKPYNYYYYCAYCDEVVLAIGFVEHVDAACCAMRSGQCMTKYRKLLPHFKALPVIEEFLRVKGVAQLIFSYYYEPRRYFPDEI